jgi:hypothetical protein
MKAHKHSKLIKAWADGQIIEMYSGNRWVRAIQPTWDESLTYRIRPPAPDNSFLVKVTQYKTGRLKIGYRREAKNPDFPADLRLVLDKDGKLMRVESLTVQPITTMAD